MSLIEEVRYLRAELQIQRLGQSEVLVRGKINVIKRGPVIVNVNTNCVT